MRVFVIAGEASGDKLGAALMDGMRHLVPDVEFDGVGGQQMMDRGLDSRFPMDELSVMGLTEILPKYRALKARVREMAEAVLQTKPDVLITIDAPEFSLRVAKLVKASSHIRTVHYVAPTVWAWRPKRAQRMAAYIDHVLALFPFEPPLMQAHGMRCDFVGHPVVKDTLAKEDEVKEWAGTKPLVLVLPGSRASEVRRLMDRFGEVVRQVALRHPDARFVIPTTANVTEHVRELSAAWPIQAEVLKVQDTGRKRGVFAAADVALAASGTVSLELAANATPMVVAYDMAWLSRVVISRMLLVDTVTLVNLVSETKAVPEFIGKDCDPTAIAKSVCDVLDAPQGQAKAMATTMKRLGMGGEDPGLRAARVVIDGLASVRQE